MSAKRGKNGKKVTDKTYPPKKKNPITKEKTNFESFHPLWNFDLLERYDQIWCSRLFPCEHFENIQPFILEIIKKLQSFKEQKWGEINQKHGCDYVPIKKLEKKARDTLKSHDEFADIQELYHLRLTGPFRIWGIRDQATFKILWLDPFHLICKSK